MGICLPPVWSLFVVFYLQLYIIIKHFSNRQGKTEKKRKTQLLITIYIFLHGMEFDFYFIYDRQINISRVHNYSMNKKIFSAHIYQ